MPIVLCASPALLALETKGVKTAAHAGAAVLRNRAWASALAADHAARPQLLPAGNGSIGILAALAVGAARASERRAGVRADAAATDLIGRIAAPALRRGRPGSLRSRGIADLARVIGGGCVGGVADPGDEALAEVDAALTTEVDVTPVGGAGQPIVAVDRLSLAEATSARAVDDAGAAGVAALAFVSAGEAAGTIAEADRPLAVRE